MAISERDRRRAQGTWVCPVCHTDMERAERSPHDPTERWCPKCGEYVDRVLMKGNPMAVSESFALAEINKAASVIFFRSTDPRARKQAEIIRRYAEQLAEQVKRGVHSNPGGEMISKDVHRIEYTHAETGVDHYHDFEGNVRAIAQPDGSIRLFNPYYPIWERQ